MRLFSWLTKQALLGLLLLVLIAVIFFLFAKASPSIFTKTTPFSLQLSIFAIFLLIYFLLLWIAFKTDHYLNNRIGKGMDGEYEIEKTLRKLPEIFLTSRDVVLGTKGNTDFVVVGPTGVWTIEVKNHKPGKITLNNDGLLCSNGYPINSETGKNILSQAYAQAGDLQTFIRESLEIYTPVYPVIVFTNPKTELRFGFNKQRGVYVVGIPFLLNLIQKNNIDNNFTPEKCLKVREELKRFTSHF